jgi:hypothetical protein
MWRNVIFILAVLLLTIACLGHFYFGNYTGTLIPHPFMFQVASWMVALTGAGLILYIYQSRKNNLDKTVAAWKENLRLNGEKIIVDFTNCEIRNNFYYEEVNKVYSSEARAYNSLIGQDYRNVEQQSRHTSVIVFSYPNPRTGEKLTFISPVISKDRITLEFLLGEKKQTVIYADRNNPENYFFDVEFLYT